MGLRDTCEYISLHPGLTLVRHCGISWRSIGSVKVICMDGGTAYRDDLQSLCDEFNIQGKLTPSNSPQYNGCAESASLLSCAVDVDVAALSNLRHC